MSTCFSRYITEKKEPFDSNKARFLLPRSNVHIELVRTDSDPSKGPIAYWKAKDTASTGQGSGRSDAFNLKLVVPRACTLGDLSFASPADGQSGLSLKATDGISCRSLHVKTNKWIGGVPSIKAGHVSIDLQSVTPALELIHGKLALKMDFPTIGESRISLEQGDMDITFRGASTDGASVALDASEGNISVRTTSLPSAVRGKPGDEEREGAGEALHERKTFSGLASLYAGGSSVTWNDSIMDPEKNYVVNAGLGGDGTDTDVEDTR